MKSIYHTHPVEDAPRSVILQNRCGNRLSLLCYDDRIELEFIYKPNAFRRKDYRARNFSNRDVFTSFFSSAELPEIKVGYVKEFEYDPFVTRLHIESPSGARNTVTVVNAADENCFAIAARCPITLAFRPHRAFEATDGLILEQFSDRGEDIVSFVSFPGFEPNRFRVLDDGLHVLQTMENEVILIGAEESRGQVLRVLRALGTLDLDKLIACTERTIAPALSQGKISCKDPAMQELIDLNRRLVYSGLDEGGACFGALNRLYYLIWIRDGSMTATMFARSGTLEMLRIWTPFAMMNPSDRLTNDNVRAREFLQILGTRWTKAEDDGIYYVVTSLFHLFTRTGSDSLLRSSLFGELQQAVDALLEKRFRPKEGLFASDTIGETTLPSSPYYGYDSVNGRMEQDFKHVKDGRKVCANMSLYYNVNMYNVVKMMQVLMKATASPDSGRLKHYAGLAKVFEHSIREKFVSPEGIYYSEILEYDDGSREKTSLTPASNPWEYSWAVTVGPFIPDHALSLASARAVAARWSKRIGYCPWNCIAGLLREYGMPSTEYRSMMDNQVNDAFNDTQKYPMRGALSEYADWKDSWRGIPFSIATFIWSVSSQLLQALPQGVAVRVGRLVDSIDGYAYRDYSLFAKASGEGDTVGRWSINGERIDHSLVVPQSLLRQGVNHISVERVTQNNQPRLFAASAMLLGVEHEGTTVRYRFTAPVRDTNCIFDNAKAYKSIAVYDSAGSPVTAELRDLLDTGKSVMIIPCEGDFTVNAAV
jgi:hypothetical protein